MSLKTYLWCHTSLAVSKSISNFLPWEMLCTNFKVHKMQDLILPCFSVWSLSLLSLSQAPLPPKGPTVCHQDVPHPANWGWVVRRRVPPQYWYSLIPAMQKLCRLSQDSPNTGLSDVQGLIFKTPP